MKKKNKFRDHKGFKSAMLQRTEDSAKNVQGSNKWRDYLTESFTGSKWKVSEGEHLIDIIPYLAGDNDPKADPETPTYFLDLWVHQRIGVTEDSFLCPASNYKGKRCPICEHIAKMKSSGNFNDDEIRLLTPKRRVLYNIVCYDSVEETNKGVQIWEASYHLTENEIVDIARGRRGEGYFPFADPDDGKSLSFFRKGQGVGTKYKGWAFVEREDTISDAILDQTYILDDLLHIPSYEELEEVFMPTAPAIDPEHSMGDDVPLGMGSEEEEKEKEEEKPRRLLRKTTRKPVEEEVEEQPESPPFTRNRLGNTRKRAHGKN